MNSPQERKKCVLVVDDEKEIVDLACAYLKEAGFEAWGAGSAAQAILAMEKRIADVVLLDIQLPGEDGLSFLKRFKKLYPHIPVIMLTGAGLMQTALLHGAAGFINKDVELEKNVAIQVKRLLG